MPSDAPALLINRRRDGAYVAALHEIQRAGWRRRKVPPRLNLPRPSPRPPLAALCARPKPVIDCWCPPLLWCPEFVPMVMVSHCGGSSGVSARCFPLSPPHLTNT